MNISEEFFQVSEVADICGISKEMVRSWDKNGALQAERAGSKKQRVYSKQQLLQFEETRVFFSGNDEQATPAMRGDYSLIELFAGAGGLALGLERCGFRSILLNEIDADACATLRKNRPHWNVCEGSIVNLDFRKHRDQVDVVTGGFPCQAFSYAGKRMGFEDTRGTLFFEFARCLD